MSQTHVNDDSAPDAPPPVEPGSSTGWDRRCRWAFKVVAIGMPPALLVLLDLTLRLVGLVPPGDPRTFYFQTHDQRFSPFVEDDHGYLTINPNWVLTGTKGRLVEAARPGHFYLPPGFRPCRFARQPSDDTIRIFVLGGSTTFGLYLEQKATFSAVLEEQLRKVAGNREVEVINLGCPGWASDRVDGVLDTLLELDPDLLIVYSGHNEMITGHWDAAAPRGFGNRLRAALVANSTILGWINHAIRPRQPPRDSEMIRKEAEARQAGYAQICDPVVIPNFQPRLLDSEFVDEAASRYERNVRSMIAKARVADVPILFCLPVSNLMAPPGVSAHSDEFAREDEFYVLVERMQEAVTRGQFDRAMTDLARAAELSPRYALVHYWRGLIHVDQGRWDAALGELRRARDCDARAYRITSRLEQKLTGTIKIAGGRLVDPRPKFHEEIQLQGDQALFFDHCHPSQLGHQLIAEALRPVVFELLDIDGDGAVSSHPAD